MDSPLDPPIYQQVIADYGPPGGHLPDPETDDLRDPYLPEDADDDQGP